MRAELPTLRPLPVAQPGRLAIGLVLACGLLVGWASLLARPHETSSGQLLDDVRGGRTALVTLERPPEATSGSGFPLRWSTGFLQNWTSRYAIGSGNRDPAVAPADFLDELRQAAASAPRPVEIRTVPLTGGHSYTDWRVLFLLLTLLLLVAGPAPVIATRWAWFWLGMAVPLCWALFLLVEPWFSPDLAGRVETRRLTGGWAFLLGLVIAGLASALLPESRDVLFAHGASAG